MAEGQRRAAFGFIFASQVLNALSFGVIIPVTPMLVKAMNGGDTSAAAHWQVILATSFGITQFFIGPVLGQLSDRFGRRPVMLISIFGQAANMLLLAFAPTLTWVLIGRLLNGATASNQSTAAAYVADVTPPDRRARSFGLVGSAFSFGMLIGPAVGGFLGDIDIRLPFLVAAGLTLVNAIYGVFVLPESLPPERRLARFDWRRANPLGSLQLIRSRPELTRLAGVYFLTQLPYQVLFHVSVLYVTWRYHWSLGFLGMTYILSGTLGFLVQSTLVGAAVERFGERGALLIGCGAGMLGFGLYGLAPVGWLYLAAMPVFALLSLAPPSLNGLMSAHVSPSEQGRLQGANQAMMGLCACIGPSVFGLAFAWAIEHDATVHLPGLAHLMAASLVGCAFLMALRFARPAAATAPAE